MVSALRERALNGAQPAYGLYRRRTVPVLNGVVEGAIADPLQEDTVGVWVYAEDGGYWTFVRAQKAEHIALDFQQVVSRALRQPAEELDV